MSVRRNFRKYINGLFENGGLKTLAEKVWSDMNVTMPMWPNADGDCAITVRVVVKDMGTMLPTMRCMRIRFLQRFKTGNAAAHAGSDCFDEYLVAEAARQGLGSDHTFEQHLITTLQNEFRDLKDYFIAEVNQERIHAN